MKVDQYLNGIFQEIIDAMPMNAGEVKGCYFRFGYWPEINAILNDLAQDKELELTRYPFVMLSAGWQEQRESELGTFAEITNLQLYIVAQSDKNYTTTQREQLVFQAVISPIYEQLIEGIKRHEAIEVAFDEFPHRVTKLYYLRNMEANLNPLRNYVEIMEIRPDSLKINEEYLCQ